MHRIVSGFTEEGEDRQRERNKAQHRGYWTVKHTFHIWFIKQEVEARLCLLLRNCFR